MLEPVDLVLVELVFDAIDMQFRCFSNQIQANVTEPISRTSREATPIPHRAPPPPSSVRRRVGVGARDLRGGLDGLDRDGFPTSCPRRSQSGALRARHLFCARQAEVGADLAGDGVQRVRAGVREEAAPHAGSNSTSASMLPTRLAELPELLHLAVIFFTHFSDF